MVTSLGQFVREGEASWEAMEAESDSGIRLICFLFNLFVVLRMELRASRMVGKHSITTPSQVHFFLLVFKLYCKYVCVHMNPDTQRDQRHPISVVLLSQLVVNDQIWVLGTKSRSPGRETPPEPSL